MRGKTRNRLKTALRILVTLTALLIIAWKIDLSRVGEALSSARLSWLLGALCLTPLCIIFKSFRWWILIREVEPEMPFSGALKSFLAGISLAVLTPGAFGELARGLYAGSPKRYELTGLAFVDKLLDLSALIVAGAVGMMVFGYLWAPVVVFGVLILLWWRVGWLTKYLNHTRLLGRFGGGISAARGYVLVLCFVLAVVFFGIYYFQGWLALRSYAEEAGAKEVALLPLTTAMKVVPSLFGIGPREATAGYLLPHYASTSAEKAVLGVFSHYLVVMLIPSVVGAFWLGKIRLRQ